MKKVLALVLGVIMMLATVPAGAADDVWVNPFADVTYDKWYYEAITSLAKQGIIESAPTFSPETFETRANVIAYLYGMHKALGRKMEVKSSSVFYDVPSGSKYHNAVCWAYDNGIASGVSANQFGPDLGITREQVATFLIRYAEKFKIKMVAVNGTEQFLDSLNISSYARSAVVACKVGGIINGYNDGCFYPQNNILKSEVASIIYKFLNTAKSDVAAGATVKTAPGHYDSLYDSYKSIAQLSFVPRVGYSAEVNASYFDDAAFVGDSITRTLYYYDQKTNAMGNAQFFFTETLSAKTAVLPVSGNSDHPVVNGAKTAIEDAIASSGAKKVYIMLGMNQIETGAKEEIENTKLLVEKIQKKVPGIQVLIQSVTPMANGAKKSTTKLNNEKIAEYNTMLEEMCRVNGWLYLHVTESLADVYTGYLLRNYCSDLPGPGIHFSDAGCAAWVTYLRTHIPAAN